MKIAVTSQNFRTVTGHGGRARRFLIYSPGGDGRLQEVERLDLPKEMAFHEFHGHGAHPLDGVDALITGGCGAGFANRLGARGVRVVTTGESDPLTAAQALLEGRPLPPPAPEDEHHEHHHHHHHHGGH
ncbi:NifB/NifX family molybdenum-iron cluster-binding protein [Endothiovibrio diazotrophicus]